MSARCGRYARGHHGHELTSSDQSSEMKHAFRTARRRMARRGLAAGFFGCPALVIDLDFDTPVLRAASGTVVRLYRP
jgi:hypothetical protein